MAPAQAFVGEPPTVRVETVVAVERLMAQQEGVLARRQALELGMSPEAWEHRVRSGRWQRPVPGVSIGHSGPATWRQHAWAAVLHVGQGAALSGRAALVEAGFTPRECPVLDVVVPPRRRSGGVRLRGGPTVVVHRTLLPDGAVRRRLGLPQVEPALAVLHAASWAASDRAAEWPLAAVVQQQLTTPDLVRRRLVAAPPTLRRRALVAAVLDDVELGAHAATELLFLRFCRRHRLPLPDVLQLRVRADGTAFLDASYLRQLLSLEIDGRHHREVRQWDADALRTLSLAASTVGTGHQLLRLTQGMLRHDEQQVASCLRVLLV